MISELEMKLMFRHRYTGWDNVQIYVERSGGGVMPDWVERKCAITCRWCGDTRTVDAGTDRRKADCHGGGCRYDEIVRQLVARPIRRAHAPRIGPTATADEHGRGVETSMRD